MSAIIETFLICDHCGVTFGTDFRALRARDHRYKAKQNGWTHIGKKDYCDQCSQLKHPLKARK